MPKNQHLSRLYNEKQHYNNIRDRDSPARKNYLEEIECWNEKSPIGQTNGF